MKISSKAKEQAHVVNIYNMYKIEVIKNQRKELKN